MRLGIARIGTCCPIAPGQSAHIWGSVFAPSKTSTCGKCNLVLASSCVVYFMRRRQTIIVMRTTTTTTAHDTTVTAARFLLLLSLDTCFSLAPSGSNVVDAASASGVHTRQSHKSTPVAYSSTSQPQSKNEFSP